MGMGKFNSDDHYVYYCGQESLRRNGVALIVKIIIIIIIIIIRVQMQYFGAILKMKESPWFIIKANHSKSQ